MRDKLQIERRKNDFYRSLFDVALDAIIVINTDDYTILDVNNSALKIFGYSYDEMLKLQYMDLSAEPEKTKYAIDTGVVYVPNRWYKKKDNSVFPVEINTVSMRFENKNILIATIKDMTENYIRQEIIEDKDVALAESEAKYRTILNHMKDVVYTYNTSGIVTYVSPSVKCFGYTCEEIVGKCILDFIHPDDKEVVFKAYQDVVNEKINKTIQFRIIDKSGNFHHIEENSEIVCNDHDEIISVVGVMRDVTDRKIIEDNLIASEKRYKAIVEDQVELICRFSPDGILTFVNKAYCDYFNKNYDDLIGTPFMNLIKDEDKKLVSDSFKKISKEQPYDHYDCKFIRNGEIKWIHWSNRAIFDDNGNISEYQSIGFDITDRKILEEKVLKSKNRYRAILDNLQEGFYQTDKDGNIIFASQSALEIFGFTNRSEVLGTSIKNYFVNPNEREAIINRTKNAGGRIFDYEVEVLNRNNEKFTISVNVQLIFDDNNNFNGTQGTFRDITEFKQRMNEIIRLYHLVEESQNALVLMETDGTIVYANKAMLAVARSPEWVTIQDYVIGKKIKSFISFDPPTTFQTVFEIVDTTNKWLGSAYASCACADIDRVPIDVMFSKITNGSGKVYIVASYYDASQYRQLEEKIKEQSRMYEELSQIMQELVDEMSEVNKKSFAKIMKLEEAFQHSVNEFVSQTYTL